LDKAYSNRCLARHMKGDWDGAFEDFNQATKPDRNLSPAYLGRAALWKEKGNCKQAIRDNT
jgi:Tfp pilus assembly protein PilF